MDHSLSLRQRPSVTSSSRPGYFPSSSPSSQDNFEIAHQVLSTFRTIQAGQHFGLEGWHEFKFRRGEYEELQRLLKQDSKLSRFVDEKIRYDYDGQSHRLALRMPTRLHEMVVCNVADAIYDEIKSIRKGSDNAAAFAKLIWTSGSGYVHCPAPERSSAAKSRKEPDFTFMHELADFPGVIMEVGYAHGSRKNLAALAERYIIRSKTGVRAVICIDVEYKRKGRFEGKARVWRPELKKVNGKNKIQAWPDLTNEDQIFRDKFGNFVEHPGLRLRLSDFANEQLTKQEKISKDQDRDIYVSADVLYQILADAIRLSSDGREMVRTECQHELDERLQGESEDELTSEDEEEFVRREKQDEERSESRDEDYSDA